MGVQTIQFNLYGMYALCNANTIHMQKVMVEQHQDSLLYLHVLCVFVCMGGWLCMCGWVQVCVCLCVCTCEQWIGLVYLHIFVYSHEYLHCLTGDLACVWLTDCSELCTGSGHNIVYVYIEKRYGSNLYSCKIPCTYTTLKSFLMFFTGT